MRRSSVSVRTTTTSRVTCRSSFGFQRRLSVLLGSPRLGHTCVWPCRGELCLGEVADSEKRWRRPVRRGSERPLFRSGSGKKRLASEKRAEEDEDQLPYSACLSETFDFQLSSGSRNEMTDAAIQKNATGAKS